MKMYLKSKKNTVVFDISKAVICLALAQTVSFAPAFSQQIIIDGKTNTNLNINGNTTTVTTTTTKGTNAFNSFSKFNVEAGKKVELVVPNASNCLINLVHDEASIIDGTLNSIKNGQIGGNVFFVNPYGITVGAEGVVNVGSLTAVTPTTDFMNSFFNAPGDPADASVIALMNGTAPINSDATIDNQGKINAITNIKIDTGNFVNSGELYTDANYGEIPDISDIVNLNSLDYVADCDYNNLILENGNIIIKADASVNASGNMFAGNTVEITSNGPVNMDMGIVMGDTAINTTGEASIFGLFVGSTTLNGDVIEPTENIYLDDEDPVLDEEDPIVGEEDLIVGEEDPILGEDDPIVGEEDPILGEEDSIWDEEDPIWGDEDVYITDDGTENPDDIEFRYDLYLCGEIFSFSAMRTFNSISRNQNNNLLEEQTDSSIKQSEDINFKSKEEYVQKVSTLLVNPSSIISPGYNDYAGNIYIEPNYVDIDQSSIIDQAAIMD